MKTCSQNELLMNPHTLFEMQIRQVFGVKGE